MLKKEVDYVPLSPKKPQLSHLGRGPSGLRPKLTERSNPSNLTSKLRAPGDVLSSEETEGEDSGKSVGATRTPRSRIGTGMGGHSRGLSVSSISSLSSTASSSDTHAPAQTSAREKAGLRTRVGAGASEFETPKASSKLHRRTQSLADFGSDSPAHGSPGAGLKTGPRSASSPTPGANRGARTMQEKKEILGTMLGNVDALVEGVKKAGVWGLS